MNDKLQIIIAEDHLEWMMRCFIISARTSYLALETCNDVILNSPTLSIEKQNKLLIDCLNAFRSRNPKLGPLPDDRQNEYLANMRERFEKS